MTPAAPHRLVGEEGRRLFGAGIDAGVELAVLGTPGVSAGAVLCRFEQADDWGTIRDRDSRLARDAFRVIDFYAPDFDRALAHVRRAGYEVEAAEAAYETADGSFREAHHWGVDNLVTALLHGPADFFTDFAQVCDRVVSEPVSISLPLSDAGPSLDWYRATFGWDVVYEYEFVDPSFSALMEIDEQVKVRSRTVGPSRQQTYINIVDYGIPHDPEHSLMGHAVAPRRGLLGLAVMTDELDEVVRRAREETTNVSAIVETGLHPFGPVRLVVLHSPIGAPHLVVEAL